MGASVPGERDVEDAPANGEHARAWTGFAVVLVLAGLAANLWRPVATGAVATATPLDDFPPELLGRVSSYVGPHRLAAVLTLVVTVAVPVAAVATRRGRRGVHRLAGAAHAAPWRGSLVAVALAVTIALVLLPVDILVGYWHEGRWGFRTSSATGWGRDWFVSHLLDWTVAAAAGAAIVWFPRRWPRTWPWRTAAVGTAGFAMLVLATPLLVETLWLDSRPLDPGPRRDAVERVLARSGMEDTPIVVGDASRRTTKVNAFVAGLGPSRRVVLYDTLLELPPDRVGLVVAHEIAHRQHDDLLRSVLLTGAGLVPALWAIALVVRLPGARRAAGARAPGDPRLVALALAVVSVTLIAGLPVGNAFSREAERAADEAALALTEDPETAIDVFRTFVVRDLADPQPPLWSRVLFATHPSPSERIRRAVAFAEREGLPLPARPGDVAGSRHEQAR